MDPSNLLYSDLQGCLISFFDQVKDYAAIWLVFSTVVYVATRMGSMALVVGWVCGGAGED